MTGERGDSTGALLDVAAAAEFLGVSRETVRRLVRQRERDLNPIPVLIVARSYRFSPEDLVDWGRRGAELQSSRKRARILSYEHSRRAAQ